jgi:hypothetical protein
MKIYILVTFFFFGGVWANNLPTEEFYNSTLNQKKYFLAKKGEIPITKPTSGACLELHADSQLFMVSSL